MRYTRPQAGRQPSAASDGRQGTNGPQRHPQTYARAVLGGIARQRGRWTLPQSLTSLPLQTRRQMARLHRAWRVGLSALRSPIVEDAVEEEDHMALRTISHPPAQQPSRTSYGPPARERDTTIPPNAPMRHPIPSGRPTRRVLGEAEQETPPPYDHDVLLLAQLIQRAQSRRGVREREWTELVQSGGMGTAWHEARRAGRELRELALTRWCADQTPPQAMPDPDLALVSLEYPDPDAPPWVSWWSFLEAATYAAGLTLARLPEPAAVADVERRAGLGTLWCWLYVPTNVGADRRRTQVIVRPWERGEEPFLAFHWACLLGLYCQRHEQLSGPQSLPGFEFLPPMGARHTTPLLHAFARSLIYFAPEEGVPPCEQMGCACPQLAAIINARPPHHAQATDVLTLQARVSGHVSGRPVVRSGPVSGPIRRSSGSPQALPQALPSQPSSPSQPSQPSLPRTVGQAYEAARARGQMPVGWREGGARADEWIEPDPLAVGTHTLAEQLGASNAGVSHPPKPWPDRTAAEIAAAEAAGAEADEWDDPGATHTEQQVTPPGGLGGWRREER